MRRWAVAVLCFLPVAALAGERIDLDSLSGVYKHRFPNGDVQGETYDSEDILEIVKLDPQTAYVRTHLEFYNGHLCALWAVGRVEVDGIRIRAHMPGNKTCDMKLVVKDGELGFDDIGNCREYFCGARGGFAGTSFPLSSRKPIHYMTRLKSSREFAQALDDAGVRR